jgi:hypothetical protein
MNSLLVRAFLLCFALLLAGCGQNRVDEGVEALQQPDAAVPPASAPTGGHETVSEGFEPAHQRDPLVIEGIPGPAGRDRLATEIASYVTTQVAYLERGLAPVAMAAGNPSAPLPPSATELHQDVQNRLESLRQQVAELRATPAERFPQATAELGEALDEVRARYRQLRLLVEPGLEMPPLPDRRAALPEGGALDALSR